MRYGTLWADLKEVVDRIARITTVLIPDDQGVELRFINNEEHGSSNLRQEHIREKMNKFKPVAGQQTEIGYNLKRKILQPLIYDKIQRDGSLERPLLISIITDGAPEGDLEKNNDFIKAINECGDFLDKQFKYPRTGKPASSFDGVSWNCC